MPLPRFHRVDFRAIPFERLMLYFGYYTLGLGLLLFFPVTLDMLRIARPAHTAWTELVAFLVMFTGLVVVWCARNIRTRAGLLYWKGILGVVLGLHLAWFGFIRYSGAMMGVFGVVDLAMGLVILRRLPTEVRLSHEQLLRDIL